MLSSYPINGDPPEKESKEHQLPGVQQELWDLKLSLYAPISFNASEGLPTIYLQRLRGKGNIVMGSATTSFLAQIDYSQGLYAKDRLLIKQSFSQSDVGLMFQSKYKHEADRAYQWGVNYVKNLSDTVIEFGLLSEHGTDELICRGRIKTTFGDDQQVKLMNRIEYYIVSGKYTGRATLSLEMFDHITPYVTARYKGNVAGGVECIPVIGLKVPIL